MVVLYVNVNLSGHIMKNQKYHQVPVFITIFNCPFSFHASGDRCHLLITFANSLDSDQSI